MLKYYLLMFAVVVLALIYAFLADPCSRLVRVEFNEKYPTYVVLDSGADKGSPDRVRCHITYRRPDDAQVYEDIWLYQRAKKRGAWGFARALETGTRKQTLE